MGIKAIIYRYPHPTLQNVWIYVGQDRTGLRDRQHRQGKTSFGRRFQKSFPGIELSQREEREVFVENQVELNEEETIDIFRYHTWVCQGGMNLVLPGSSDYENMAKVLWRSKSFEERKNWSLKARSKVSKERRQEISRKIQANLTFDQKSRGGKKSGLRNVENGLLDRIRGLITPEIRSAAVIKGNKTKKLSGFDFSESAKRGHEKAGFEKYSKAISNAWHRQTTVEKEEIIARLRVLNENRKITVDLVDVKRRKSLGESQKAIALSLGIAPTTLCKKLKEDFMKTTIPDYAMNEEQFHSRPDAGTRSVGKSNDPEATLRKGSLPKAVSVQEAHCDNGEISKKAIAQQIGMHDIGSDGAPGISGNGLRGN